VRAFGIGGGTAGLTSTPCSSSRSSERRHDRLAVVVSLTYSSCHALGTKECRALALAALRAAALWGTKAQALLSSLRDPLRNGIGSRTVGVRARGKFGLVRSGHC